MAIDYSKGRYLVYGPTSELMGRIDEDEFVRQPGIGAKLMARIDGEEVYDLQGNLLGFISDSVARTPAGVVIFTIQPE